jgi:transcriptional regulator with XRE-family HTH domain
MPKGIYARKPRELKQYPPELVARVRDLYEGGMTQVEVAAALGTSQDRISKLEHGEDALVSTLRRHVRALGGELRLIVEFPDRPPMTIELRGGKARAGRAGGVRAVR